MKGFPPSFSTARRIATEDIPPADLKAKSLLAKAAPLSPNASAEEPPLGNVNETVDVTEASSDTTIRPLSNLVMLVFPILAGVGVTIGRLKQNPFRMMASKYSDHNATTCAH